MADAHAKARRLQIRPLDPAADRAALERLALWATRYAPSVAAWDEENGADGFFLDIAGAAHLFGGEEELLRDCRRRLARFGLPARLALADTPGAGWALARYGRSPVSLVPSGGEAEALAALPIDALRLGRETCLALKRLGLERIGDLLDKPRPPLTKRFGARLLQRLDQALGRCPEPLAWLAPPPVYSATKVFDEPVMTQEAIVAAATALMEELAPALERDHVGLRRFRLDLYRVDGKVVNLDFGLARPTRSADHIRRLVALRLEQLKESF